jgi:hypothetical protein
MIVEDLAFENLTKEILKPYSKRAPTESLQFLRWFLENIFRQDSQDADDACVDMKHDKGVDGILVNDVVEAVYVFQAKIKQKEKASLGDTDIKEFVGTLEQFSTAENVQALLNGNAAEALKAAITRNDIKEKISRGYSVEGVFCTNAPLNADGKAYAETVPHVTVYDAIRISAEHVDIAAPTGISGDFTFDLSDSEVIKYQTSDGVKTRIFLASALQLTHLQGISDGSLFSLNVRLSLGNTKVNKDLILSIKDKKEHKNFPLYHNGITLLCASFEEVEGHALKVKEYVVVNGAQSLTSLLTAKASITQDLRVLTKVVALEGFYELSEKITQNSNNQNATKPRDMRSNHGLQQRLRQEISDLGYRSHVLEVKRGESNRGAIAISNEDAGLALLAIDLKEPWSCHQKYKVMDDSHSKIFGRSDVSGAKVVLFWLLINALEELADDFDDNLLGSYSLTKYFLAFAVSEILRETRVGSDLLADPRPLFEKSKVESFVSTFSELARTTIDDLEAEISEQREDGGFDHKRDLKSPKWCRQMSMKLKAAYKKDVKRKRAKPVDELVAAALI